ncbi:hypothetical protein B0H15DRAFT_788911, partial [Mycena belliarum]
MFSRGHVHDTSCSVSIESWGALDFFQEVFKKDPTDVATLFELWVISCEKGTTGGDTLQEMQHDCTQMIKTGLQQITKKTKVTMNYENYINSMVIEKNVGLVGWPKSTTFKRMSKQSAIKPLRALRDALRSGECRWKVLKPSEREHLIANFNDMVEKGEATEKVQKKKA